MEVETKISIREILIRLARLQAEVNLLKQKEISEDKTQSLSVVEESLAEIWDNEEDERWNEC